MWERKLNKAFFRNQVNELREALGPLSGRSLKYCNDGCLRRYLEARNWNVEKSKKMLEESLKWRETFKPEEIRWVRVILMTFSELQSFIFCFITDSYSYCLCLKTSLVLSWCQILCEYMNMSFKVLL